MYHCLFINILNFFKHKMKGLNKMFNEVDKEWKKNKSHRF